MQIRKYQRKITSIQIVWASVPEIVGHPLIIPNPFEYYIVALRYANLAMKEPWTFPHLQ